MDNLSHSVAGLAVGELVHRSLPQEADHEHHGLRRRVLLVTSWLASNFPDLDLVLTPLLPAPLGYLLHHRGHTHTLLYAIPQALLLAAMLWLLWPGARRLLKESATARTGFVLSLGIGFALHVLMDWLNSYGIHPFHPFDSRWFYGDMVFILEPVFWIAFGVPLAMMVQRPWMKVLLLALLIGVPLFFTTRGYLPWGSLALLAGIAVVLAVVQYKAAKHGSAGLILAMIIAAGFVGAQGFASGQARQTVERYLQHENPDGRMLDAAMTSFPSNPFCWLFVSVESNEAADSYRLRRGLLSLAPGLMPVTACPPSLSEHAALSPVTPAIAFLSQHEGSLSALRSLGEENCHFNAWLRFARAPLLVGDQASDLRFMSASRGNFTTIFLDGFKDHSCSPHVPQWGFPRADMLRQR